MRSTPETKLFAAGSGVGLFVGIGAVVIVIYLAKKLGDAVHAAGDFADKASRAAGASGDLATDVGHAARATGDFISGTAQSARDLENAAIYGQAPNDANSNDAAINYFESLHDLVFHPVDSLKTIFGGN